MTNIGYLLRRIRRVEELTLAVAAKPIGIAASTLLRIENGSDSMDSETALKLIHWAFSVKGEAEGRYSASRRQDISGQTVTEQIDWLPLDLAVEPATPSEEDECESPSNS